ACPSTVTPRWSCSRRIGQLRELCCTATETSGGSRETPTVKVEATRPWRTPSISAATRTMPWGKWENASRSAVSVSMSATLGVAQSTGSPRRHTPSRGVNVLRLRLPRLRAAQEAGADQADGRDPGGHQEGHVHAVDHPGRAVLL